MSTFKFETDTEVMKPWLELQNTLRNSGVIQFGIDIGYSYSEFKDHFKAPHDDHTVEYAGAVCVASEIFKTYQIGFRIGGMTDDAVNYCKKKSLERCKDIVLEMVASFRDKDISAVPPLVGLIWREPPMFDCYEDTGEASYRAIPEYVDHPIKMGCLYFRVGVTSYKEAAAISARAYAEKAARAAKLASNPLGAPPGMASNSNKSTEQV